MATLSPSERRLIRGVVEAFRPPDLGITAEAIAARGARFVEDLAASGSERVEEVRRILTLLDVALAFVDTSNRQAVRDRLTEMEKGSGLFGLLPKEARDLARFAQRLAFILIYGTLDEAGRPIAALALGYDAFANRPRGGTVTIPPERLLPRELFVLPSDPLPDREYDVVVVGSGAAGAVLVRRLVEDHGLHVALVESGHYVPESVTPAQPHFAPRQYPHDEIEALSRYYKHAGLQLTRGHTMFVFQAECLGGASIVNNAVCFRMPEQVRDVWNREYGIPWTGDELSAAYDRIAAEVRIASADRVVLEGFLNATADRLRTGAEKLAREFKPCDVNISHEPQCLGCGYCNLVCAYLRKNSVLQTMLPAAATAARTRGSLTIYTGRKAVKVVGERLNGTYRARGVLVRTKAPKPPYSYAAVRAGKVVISAGAVGSSGILERTEALNDLDLPIGKRFSFNFGSPIHADYDDPVRAFDGLQIAHYYNPGADAGFVIETWYNPPATQTLALPGWMDDLERNVRRYSHLACAAPLIGSSAESWIDADWRDEGEDIHVRLAKEDMDRLKAGLRTTCELFFASDPAPRRVLLSTLDDWEVAKGNFGDRIDRLREFSEIQIGTGHPQGGNCMAARGGHEGAPGVVRPDFRVHGSEALWSVDAGVFPTSLGVNPHWTVMALADLASSAVAEA